MNHGNPDQRPLRGQEEQEDRPIKEVDLTHEQVEQIGRELEELRARVMADVGESDREYIYKIIRAQRGLEIGGRALMYPAGSRRRGSSRSACRCVEDPRQHGRSATTSAHGQYDWMREDTYNSREFEWDTVCPADQWKHSHNYMHHTYTNIVGEDRDVGYGILRMSRDQDWNPYYLGNLGYATAPMVLFEWGVMLHDLETERIVAGERKWSDVKGLVKGMWRKASKQVLATTSFTLR